MRVYFFNTFYLDHILVKKPNAHKEILEFFSLAPDESTGMFPISKSHVGNISKDWRRDRPVLYGITNHVFYRVCVNDAEF